MNNLKILSLNILLVFTFSLSVLAQADLTPTQLKEYNKQKLTIEAWGSGRGSYGSGNISYTYSTKWSAYQGFNRISEGDFYTMTGHYDLAEELKIYKKKGKKYRWIGIGGIIGGGILAIGGASMENPSLALVLGGLGIEVLGGAFLITSFDINSSNLKPYGVASGIADEFNSQLIITIRKRF